MYNLCLFIQHQKLNRCTTGTVQHVEVNTGGQEGGRSQITTVICALVFYISPFMGLASSEQCAVPAIRFLIVHLKALQ
jgi:xanthine/uracil/vitamin C permease (AzgA family)